jgi:glycopeptide antibiotics resistance protein
MTSAGVRLKITGWIFFLFFLLLLTRNILFKHRLSYYRHYFRNEYPHYSMKEGWAQANTKPFHTIRLFYNSRNLTTDYKANNLLGNIIGFLPLGILLPFLLPWFRNVLIITFAGFIISLGYETSQLVLGLGVFDVDDLILNTTGTLFGYMAIKLLARAFGTGKVRKVENVSRV